MDISSLIKRVVRAHLYNWHCQNKTLPKSYAEERILPICNCSRSFWLAATILWINLDCKAYPERRLLKSINSFPLFSYICTGVCNFSLFALLESYCHHQEKCSVSSWGSAKEGLILLLDTQIGLVTKLTFIKISQLWLKFSSDWPKFWAKSTLF